jgi:small subunit ribosomal protein S3
LGQKVNPTGFRLGVTKSWNSRWFAGKEYSKFIIDDYKIRDFLRQKLQHAGIANIEIERWANRIRLRIYTARPGIVIGKKGAEIEQLKKELEKFISQELIIDIQEVRKPEVDAQLVAENVAMQIVRYQDILLRSFRRRRDGPNGVVQRRKNTVAYFESGH